MWNGKSDRKKTISSVFFRYACVYTAGVLFLVAILFLIWYILDETGEVLPANHMEISLNESADEIRKASEVTEELLPEGCTYGVYRADGSWRYGTFPTQEIRQAWENYEQRDIYTRGRGYYRFFQRDSGEVCIVKYEIATRFRNRSLEKFLPDPDVLLVLSFIVLFLVYTVLMSRRFGKYMRARLQILNEATERIRRQDLEFAEEHSELREVDNVLRSLYQMKEALKESLYRQWDMEKDKEEQIAALAHDIKTPLTIIRGNAELLDEGEMGEDEKAYNKDILQSVSMMEGYLAMLNEILTEDVKKGTFGPQEEGIPQNHDTEISTESLADEFMEQARLLSSARQYPVIFHRKELHGRIRCSMTQILRAFHNILSNAMDYGPPEGKIDVWLEMRHEDRRTGKIWDGRGDEQGKEKEYLTVVIIDEGPGFTAQDLKHATEQFYQGDKSRNSKTHYGIGLHTAEKFAEAQGGHLVIENMQARGGKVSMYVCLCPEIG